MLLVSPTSTPPRHETSTSQLDGPSGRFALSGARLPADTERVLTVLSVEVHVRTRSDLRPDPAHDPVQCVLWCARGYGVDAPLEAGAMHWGTVNSDPRQADIEDLAGTSLHRTGVATPSLRTQVVRSELDLLHAVIDLVHSIHRVPSCFVLRFSSSGFAVYSNGTDCSFVFAQDDELPSADIAFDDLRAGGVLIPAEITLEGFADADKDLELCAELTDDEIIHQVTEDSDDSDTENEEPAPTQPTNTELTRALMTLSLVYSGNMTLTEIEADLITGMRIVQKKICDFFAPKC
ncbi:hypothetical protein HPB52_018321 [Rhipicephalus sanguineus]|uniref:Uncharacterized protein n=1 Tax=Rhipicephalus sanguineus TaxID=34632 RepID=A0A9D4SUT8_RHISA|nr:hypothetical protein HPB52_018321 [Rhipicephalus sanguineus]